MSAALENRVALVTGAASGIGRAIALALAGSGAAVTLVDLDLPAVKDIAAQITTGGGQALALKCDVTDPFRVQEVVLETVEVFGGLHILVNSAGICPLRSFEEISVEEWNRVLAVNLSGPFLFCQTALPHLRNAGEKGRIINIASLAGQIGGIAVGAHYSASKGGLIILTRQLAKLLAPDHVTVNNISPGTADTPLTQAWGEETQQALLRQIPMGRLGTPQDTAALALFLASDEASYITGATINVNGGLFVG
jgi:3-oxoacyl-[acyl-carrier protein] reductase